MTVAATRIRTFDKLSDKVPAGTHVEVWGDNTVWLYTDDMKRIRLVDFITAGFPPHEEWPNA